MRSAEPEARITAIDISKTSLRHTGTLQRKYDLENLELLQLPIERVQELGRSFDLIVCTGVLHHLSDPDAGLECPPRGSKPPGRYEPDGLRTLRPGGDLHDAGVLPPAEYRHFERRIA